MVTNNSLVTLSVVLQRANIALGTYGLYPLVCQGIARGQWYEPNGFLYPAVNNTGDYGQLNGSAGVELYRGSPSVFPHGVQCCTNTSITLCVGMYSDLKLAASVNLSTEAATSYALSVAATCKLGEGTSHVSVMEVLTLPQMVLTSQEVSSFSC